MASPHKMSIRFFNDREVPAVWDDEHHTISILQKSTGRICSGSKVCGKTFDGIALRPSLNELYRK